MLGARRGLAKQAKFGKKQAKQSADTGGAKQAMYDRIVKALEARPPPRPNHPPEVLAERKKIVDLYHKMRQKEHNAFMKDLGHNGKLKWAAVDALPSEELREEALTIDERPFPAHRRIFTWTPPTKLLPKHSNRPESLE